MAKALMVLGTCSNAGKSLITAGICRILKQEGYKVAPFKAQNMALNSYITKDGLEMGRAQVMQAEACGLEPDCRMNPVLLKPTSDKGSQVILNGKVYGNMKAQEFYENKPVFREEIRKTYNSLAEEYDVIVMEGAGSPAEINLRDNDLVNMGMAKMADAPAILVGDIDRGGVFASLAGTMLLFDEDERARVKGVVINKFRGDLEILKPGLSMLEDIIKVPVLGVVPYMNVDIDDEDSLSEKFTKKDRAALIDIAVIRLPRISNFTDFNVLEYMEGVGVRYVKKPGDLGDPDLVIIPGTKNTMGDLLWMRQCGMEANVLKYASGGKPIIGVCGGYQILGKKISDPGGVEHGGELDAMGLLPHSTIFADEKVTKEVTGKLSSVTGIFSELSGKEYTGYEIHMGSQEKDANIINRGNVYGTYVHGVFDREGIASTLVKALFKEKGLDPSEIEAFNLEEYKQRQYDILADGMRKALNMDMLLDIIR